jgi:hypothetical protein
MPASKTYRQIVAAVTAKQLREPFGEADFRAACPGCGEGTYKAFLHKHAEGNSGGESELVERVSPGRFKLIRPLKYGL